MKLHRLISLITVVALTGCNSDLDSGVNQGGPQGPQVVPIELVTTNVIRNVGLNIMAPMTAQFSSEIGGLNQALGTMCEELNTRSELSQDELQQLRTPVQQAWKKAMTTYHQLEMFQFGPVKDPLSIAMKNLYTFDGAEKCRIELLIERSRTPSLKPTADNGFQLIGLDAIEHLLFIAPDQSLCERQRPNSWFNTKSLLQRQRDMCSYMSYIGQDLATQATTLQNDWSTSGSDYTAQMLINNVHGSKRDTIGHISQALFYLYGEVSDLKIATPAGIKLHNNRVPPARGCSDPCPQKVEHPYAGFSVEALIANINGFSMLFNGLSPVDNANGASFDDLVVAEGFPSLVTEINQAIAAAKANLERLVGQQDLGDLARQVEPEQCLNSTSTSRTNELCAIYQDIRAITGKLQDAQVVLKGLLSQPATQTGDND